MFLLWIPFASMFIYELIWVITYPSEAFQVLYPCLPFSPFKRLLFLTFPVRLFSQGLCSKIFIGSRTILPRILKSIFLFDLVLGVVTIQLPLEFHPIFYYLKPHGFTWDKRGSFPWCLMNLCLKFQLNPLRKSKFIGLPVQVTEFGY